MGQMSLIDRHVGQMLAGRRIAKSMTVDGVAATLKIDLMTLYRIEEGSQRASAEQLRLLCQLYGMTPADFLPNTRTGADG